MIRRTNGERVFDAANVALMAVVTLVMLFPMWHVLSVSLSSGPETMKGGLFLWPRNMEFAAYEIVFQEPLFFGAYLNTILYTLVHTFLVLFLSSLTAYPLAVQGFCLKRFVTIFLTITMFVSGGMIPTYMLIRSMGMIDTFWVMVIPGTVGCYNVVLFRTFFQGNAIELREAAIIDGAGEFRTLSTIVVPLSKPIFATLGLFTAVGKWNSWYDALIYLNSEVKYPVQMILRRILFSVTQLTANVDEYTASMYASMQITAQNVRMADVLFTALPIILIYPFVQRYFVKGVFVGSLKG